MAKKIIFVIMMLTAVPVYGLQKVEQSAQATAHNVRAPGLDAQQGKEEQAAERQCKIRWSDTQELILSEAQARHFRLFEAALQDTAAVVELSLEAHRAQNPHIQFEDLHFLCTSDLTTAQTLQKQLSQHSVARLAALYRLLTYLDIKDQNAFQRLVQVIVDCTVTQLTQQAQQRGLQVVREQLGSVIGSIFNVGEAALRPIKDCIMRTHNYLGPLLNPELAPTVLHNNDGDVMGDITWLSNDRIAVNGPTYTSLWSRGANGQYNRETRSHAEYAVWKEDGTAFVKYARFASFPNIFERKDGRWQSVTLLERLRSAVEGQRWFVADSFRWQGDTLLAVVEKFVLGQQVQDLKNVYVQTYQRIDGAWQCVSEQKIEGLMARCNSFVWHQEQKAFVCKSRNANNIEDYYLCYESGDQWRSTRLNIPMGKYNLVTWYKFAFYKNTLLGVDAVQDSHLIMKKWQRQGEVWHEQEVPVYEEKALQNSQLESVSISGSILSCVYGPQVAADGAFFCMLYKIGPNFTLRPLSRDTCDPWIKNGAIFGPEMNHAAHWNSTGLKLAAIASRWQRRAVRIWDFEQGLRDRSINELLFAIVCENLRDTPQGQAILNRDQKVLHAAAAEAPALQQGLPIRKPWYKKLMTWIRNNPKKAFAIAAVTLFGGRKLWQKLKQRSLRTSLTKIASVVR